MRGKKLTELRVLLGELADVKSAIALLEWDQETYMPAKGAAARGQQLATLSAVAHRMQTAEELAALLQDLHAQADKLDADDAALVSESLYDYTRATRLPEEFVHRFAEEQSKAFSVWIQARPDSDFAAFRPCLERIVDLLRQKARLLGYEDSPYDALIEEYERGMTTKELRALFSDLGPKQAALIQRVVSTQAASDPEWLAQDWDEGAQSAFTLQVLDEMGFDFQAGRQDRSPHPFTTSFDIHDVRVTTRFDRRNPFSALLGSVHEGGHALYDQGYLKKDRRTPLAQGPSLGMHESQSRLWENFVARSLPFWRHHTPILRSFFPGQIDNLAPEEIYRALNRVYPSLIRVEADECTYNLHIILRFKIEQALIEGNMKVSEIPEAWNDKMKRYLQIDVPDDAHGCLQDVHWAHGAMGYFPTYTLGNIYATQLFEKALADVPDMWKHIGGGNCQPLLEWLRERVHRIGRRKTAVDIIKDVTGQAPSAEPYLKYLDLKYSTLYKL